MSLTAPTGTSVSALPAHARGSAGPNDPATRPTRDDTGGQRHDGRFAETKQIKKEAEDKYKYNFRSEWFRMFLA